MFYEEDDYYNEDEYLERPMMENTFADHERTGFAVHPLLRGANILGKEVDHLQRINMSDQEKFAESLQPIFIRYKEELGWNDQYNVLYEILNYVENNQIENPNHKDPLCILLGYYLVDNKKRDVKCKHPGSKENCQNCRQPICKRCMEEDQNNIYMITEMKSDINLCMECMYVLSKERFNNINFQRLIKDNNINKVDIIRYSRLWMNIKNKEIIESK